MKIVLNRLKTLEIVKQDPLIPDIPDGSVRVEVLCCAVCRTDAKMWEQGHRDLILPRIMGHEMVVRDTDGNRFMVWPGTNCTTCRYCRQGLENLCEEMKIIGFHHDGGFASHVVVPSRNLVPLPAGLDNHIACFGEPVGCIINAFEKIEYKRNSRLLIYGGGTMGLAAALYAKSIGLQPLVIEKKESKIHHVRSFLDAAGICCEKDTHHSEFDLVINACPDVIAFCQAVSKVARAGWISFFSGITKNETIDTNLVNLIHYKEAKLAGAYGMTRTHMEKAIPFMTSHQAYLKLLIQDIVPPHRVPALMPKVLSGNDLKYILDFTLAPRDPWMETSYNKASVQPVKINTAAGRAVSEKQLFQDVVKGIRPLSNDLFPAACAKIDEKTKPLGALGKLESLAVRMSLIQGRLNPALRRKALFVFAGDHGITEEGVSAYPREVTGQMVENFLNGGAAINVLCCHHGIDLKVVDMGVVKSFAPHPDLIIRKVGPGTRNFALEPAMSRSQAVDSLEKGMAVFLEAFEKEPVDIVGLGEMGIGNTTSASAIICTVCGLAPEVATGRGTGVDNKGLAHKTQVIERVLAFHGVNPQDGLDILTKIGGFELGGIAGAALAAASRQTAVVLDGLISTAAGLIAYAINPGIKGYLISGHKSVEPAQAAALSFMGLTPLIDFDMRLGEGTGAALAIDMADAACKIMTRMASFDEAKISRASLGR